MAIKPRRSLLSVPADRVRFHEKADQIPADEVMFDLEDSVAPTEKVAARTLMVESLRRLEFANKIVAVRLNSLSSPWFEADVAAALNCRRVDTLVVPKVTSADDVHTLEAMIKRRRHSLGLEPQIETAAGLEHAGEIAAASDLVEALHFGPLDLAASLGAPLENAIAEDLYSHSLVRVLVAARAAQRQALDGPFVDIHDARGLELSAQRAARMGYDGKWAIHPEQVAVLNTTFTPSRSQAQRARGILTAYATALAEGRGAVMFQGMMLDEAIRRWAEMTVARLGHDTPN